MRLDHVASGRAPSADPAGKRDMIKPATSRGNRPIQLGSLDRAASDGDRVANVTISGR
jgi:hypothetical protein